MGTEIDKELAKKLKKIDSRIVEWKVNGMAWA